MMDFLDNLRKKPEHVRKRIAVATTLALFSLIFSVWWTTFNASGTSNAGSAVALSDVVSPLGVVANMIWGVKDRANEMVATLQNRIQYSASSSTLTAATDDSIMASDGTDTPTERNDMNYPDGLRETPPATDNNTAPSSAAKP